MNNIVDINDLKKYQELSIVLNFLIVILEERTFYKDLKCIYEYFFR